MQAASLVAKGTVGFVDDSFVANPIFVDKVAHVTRSWDYVTANHFRSPSQPVRPSVVDKLQHADVAKLLKLTAQRHVRRRAF